MKQCARPLESLPGSYDRNANANAGKVQEKHIRKCQNGQGAIPFGIIITESVRSNKALNAVAKLGRESEREGIDGSK